MRCYKRTVSAHRLDRVSKPPGAVGAATHELLQERARSHFNKLIEEKVSQKRKQQEPKKKTRKTMSTIQIPRLQLTSRLPGIKSARYRADSERTSQEEADRKTALRTEETYTSAFLSTRDEQRSIGPSLFKFEDRMDPSSNSAMRYSPREGDNTPSATVPFYDLPVEDLCRPKRVRPREEISALRDSTKLLKDLAQLTERRRGGPQLEAVSQGDSMCLFGSCSETFID